MEAHRLSNPAALVERRRRRERLFALGLRVLLRLAGPRPETGLETGQDNQQRDEYPEAANYGSETPGSRPLPPPPRTIVRRGERRRRQEQR